MDLTKNEIFTRRSIRSYLPQEIEQEKLDRIVRAGMQAPSALDGQCWELILVRSQEGKDKLAQMSKYSDMAKDAAAAIIVCVNLNRAGASGEKDWWIQGVSACTQNILLQIVKEGLGGVWLGCYPRQPRMDLIKKEFGLPDGVEAFAVIPFGYSKEENKFEDRFDADKLHFEKY